MVDVTILLVYLPFIHVNIFIDNHREYTIMINLDKSII